MTDQHARVPGQVTEETTAASEEGQEESTSSY